MKGCIDEGMHWSWWLDALAHQDFLLHTSSSCPLSICVSVFIHIHTIILSSLPVTAAYNGLALTPPFPAQHTNIPLNHSNTIISRPLSHAPILNIYERQFEEKKSWHNLHYITKQRTILTGLTFLQSNCFYRTNNNLDRQTAWCVKVCKSANEVSINMRRWNGINNKMI